MTIMTYIQTDFLDDPRIFRRVAQQVGAKVFNDRQGHVPVYGMHLTEEQFAMFLLAYPLDPELPLQQQFQTFTYELGHPFISPDKSATPIIEDCFGIIRNPLHIDKNNQFFITSSGGEVIELGDCPNEL